MATTSRTSIERIARKIDALPPITVFVGFMAAGVLMILLSYPADLARTACPNGATLGYLYEVQWIVNHTFTLPCAAALALLAMNSARQGILGLVASNMIVDRNGTPVSVETVQDSWYAALSRTLRWAAAVSAVGFVVSYCEWYGKSIRPLMSGLAVPCGWATAASVDPAHVSKVANIIFGFLAYSMQGVGVSVFVAFVFVVTAFSAWIYRFTTSSDPLELLPDVRSRDPRRGFQVFEPFVTNMLYCGLAFFLIFFVIRVHYLFLSSARPGSVYGFGTSEVILGVFTSLKTISASRASVLFATGTADQFPVVMSSVGLVCVVGIAVLVPTTILLQAAQRSRARCLTFVAGSNPIAVNAHRPDPASQALALQRMQVWPVDYPRPVTLLAFGLVALVAYLFYRFSFALLGLCLVSAIRIVTRSIRSATRPESPAPIPGGDPGAVEAHSAGAGSAPHV